MSRQKQSRQKQTAQSKIKKEKLFHRSVLWQRAFEQLSQAVVIKDQHRKVIEANPAFYQLIGMEPSEAAGKLLEEILAPGETEVEKTIQAEFEKRKAGITSAYTVKIGKGETEKMIHVQASPIFDDEGVFLGSVAIISEATDSEVSNREALLRAIYNLADIGMCVTDSKGRFVEVNPAYCRTYGYTREELIGQSFTIVLPPELREYAQQLHNDYIAEGTDQSGGEWQVLHKDGTIRDVWVTASRLILKDGRRFKLTTVADITERKWIERQLRYQANLLQNISEAIISVDNDLKITSWNRAAETMYGWKESEVIGKHFYQVVPTRYLNNMNHELVGESLKTVGEWSGEVIQLRRDGKEMIVQSSVSLIRNAQGKGIGCVAINRDLTEQKALERERAELYEQLQQLQKMEAIGTLSGGIAHDFNNILAAILGNANLILEKTTDEKLRKYAERIKVASERGSKLTQQLLGYARKGKFEVAPVDLQQCVKNVVEILEHSIDKRIQIHILSEEHLPKLMGDRTQLEQVIMNIAVNAVDAIMPTLNEKQFGTLTFSLKVETPEKRHFISNQPHLHLTVSDTGVGIPKEIQNRIFEPFFTTKEVGKGTGLGLAMVYGIVRNHQGMVYIDSEVGKGTTVHLYLPLLSQPQPYQSNTVIVKDSKADVLGNKRILIVDDEEMLRELLVEQLTSAGYSVYEAANGLEAIEVLKHLSAQQISIDAIVLDINMPKMSGARAFSEIRTLLPSVPVVIATGFAQDEVVQKMLENGANGVLTKPYSVEELLKKLEEVCNVKMSR